MTTTKLLDAIKELTAAGLPNDSIDTLNDLTVVVDSRYGRVVQELYDGEGAVAELEWFDSDKGFVGCVLSI
jgi:hypothetical protein